MYDRDSVSTLVTVYMRVLTLIYVADMWIVVSTHVRDGDNVFEFSYKIVYVWINVFEGVSNGDIVIEFEGKSRLDKVSTFEDVTEGDNVSEFTNVEGYVWAIVNDDENAFSFIIISVHGNEIEFGFVEYDDVDAAV